MNDQTERADEKKRKSILAIIRNLMARTVANGVTEAEAKEASAKVDELMASYEIDLTEATVGEQEIVRVDIALNHHPVRFAASMIGIFTDCRAWYDANDGRNDLCFLGLEIDTQIAEYLLLLFQRSIDREIRQYSMLDPDVALADAAGVRVKVHSFGVGMAVRLGERLHTLKGKRDFTQRKSGFDLVLAKKPLIDEAWASLGINLGRDRYGGSIKDSAAYAAGQSAGDRVSINHGVGGSAGAASARIR
jgi:hypothetical protein